MAPSSKNLRALFIGIAGTVALIGCTTPGPADPFPYRKGQGPIPPGYQTGVRQEAVITLTSGAHKEDALKVTYDAINYYPSMRMAHRFIFKDGMMLTVNLATKQAFIFYPHAKAVHSFIYNALPRRQNGEPHIEKILQGLLGGEVTLLTEAHPPLMVFSQKTFEFPGPHLKESSAPGTGRPVWPPTGPTAEHATDATLCTADLASTGVGANAIRILGEGGRSIVKIADVTSKGGYFIGVVDDVYAGRPLYVMALEFVPFSSCFKIIGSLMPIRQAGETCPLPDRPDLCY